MKTHTIGTFTSVVDYVRYYIIILLTVGASLKNLARTDAQYYSSSFFSSPVQPLKKSFLFRRPGPARWKNYLSLAEPARPGPCRALMRMQYETFYGHYLFERGGNLIKM